MTSLVIGFERIANLHPVPSQSEALTLTRVHIAYHRELCRAESPIAYLSCGLTKVSQDSPSKSNRTNYFSTMALRILSLIDELESACNTLPENGWHDQSSTVRRRACEKLHKLSTDLEDPGDLVDRVVYQVRFTP